MDEPLVHLIWRRAVDRCEYRQMPQALSFLPFEIDHVIARKHHAKSLASNLALACAYNNAFKGPNIAALSRAPRLLSVSSSTRKKSFFLLPSQNSVTMRKRFEVSSTHKAPLATGRSPLGHLF
jgi:hypothetical protein